MPNAIRPELELPPLYMADLPLDSRGYPVPWFVDWLTNEAGERVPEFRAMDLRKWERAVKQHLCWVCGKQLGVYVAFVIGPMCGVNRTTSEPPCHRACAEWSARNCPFLSRPHMTRREMDHPDINPGAGCPISRNPGTTLVWIARDYEVFSDGKGGYLIHLGEPVSISFWAEGKAATRAQIDASVDSGIPILEEVGHVDQEPGARAELNRLLAVFRKLLPAA